MTHAQATADDPLMTPGQAADALGVDTDTLARWATAGRIEAVTLPSRQRRYPLSEITRILATRTGSAPDAV